jgi:hypothetical protein
LWSIKPGRLELSFADSIAEALGSISVGFGLPEVIATAAGMGDSTLGQQDF